MDFTEGSIYKKLIKFATPLFLGQLLQILYNMVDMVIVGRAVGKVGLSAVSVGGDLISFLNFMVMGFANAASVIISQYIGAGKRKEVGNFIGTFAVFSVISTAVTSAVCLILRTEILGLLNTPEEAFYDALQYSTVTMIGFMFIFGYNAIAAILRGLGDSKHPFVFIAFAAVLNVILDIIFVYFMDLRAFGAALATVISQGLSFVLCAVFLMKNRERFRIEMDRSALRIDRSELSTLLNLGIPMAIKQTAIHFSKLFVNSFVNSYGITVSAVCGIVTKIASISNQSANSFNTAGSSMVGQNIGAERYDRVPRVLFSVASIVFMINIVFAGLMTFVPEMVFGIFTDDPDVIEVAMEYVPYSYILFLGIVCRAWSNSLVNGSGNFKVNFVVAILDGIVLRMGLAYLFGIILGQGYHGFWLGDTLAGVTPLFIAIVFYFSGAWKTRKYVIKEKK
ncbi:MAG: MATE family efflux transporter [Clostridia bacterium]|nr:MATE family efflux transporter [Clostridia bacterium]